MFAIARGSDVVSGELGRGTLEMLLAQPVSRLQVLYTQAAVTLVCLLLLCGADHGRNRVRHLYDVKVKEDFRRRRFAFLAWALRFRCRCESRKKSRCR